MIDPAEALQRALFSTLTPIEGLAAVYDDVPPAEQRAFPYATIWDVQRLDGSAECLHGTEMFVDVHVWSRATGTLEAKRLGGLIRAALHGVDLDLSPWENRLVWLRFQTDRLLRDPDGVTKHGVLTFRAFTVPAD